MTEPPHAGRQGPARPRFQLEVRRTSKEHIDFKLDLHNALH